MGNDDGKRKWKVISGNEEKRVGGHGESVAAQERGWAHGGSLETGRAQHRPDGDPGGRHARLPARDDRFQLPGSGGTRDLSKTQVPSRSFQTGTYVLQK